MCPPNPKHFAPLPDVDPSSAMDDATSADALAAKEMVERMAIAKGLIDAAKDYHQLSGGTMDDGDASEPTISDRIRYARTRRTPLLQEAARSLRKWITSHLYPKTVLTTGRTSERSVNDTTVNAPLSISSSGAKQIDRDSPQSESGSSPSAHEIPEIVMQHFYIQCRHCYPKPTEVQADYYLWSSDPQLRMSYTCLTCGSCSQCAT